MIYGPTSIEIDDGDARGSAVRLVLGDTVETENLCEEVHRKKSPCGCSPRHRRRYAEIEFTSLPCVLKQNERIRGIDNLQVQALLIPVRRILRDYVVVEAIGG